jgi:hypothetical protein
MPLSFKLIKYNFTLGAPESGAKEEKKKYKDRINVSLFPLQPFSFLSFLFLHTYTHSLKWSEIRRVRRRTQAGRGGKN